MMQADTWPLPDETDELVQQVAELGPPLAEFTAGRWQRLLHSLGAPLMFLFGWALTLAPLFLLFGRGRGGGLLLKLALVGLMLVASAVILVIRGFRNRGLRVLVYPEGLIRLQRDRATALLWEEVEAVQRKSTDGLVAQLTNTSLTYTLRRQNGEQLTFDQYLDNLPELGKILERETLPHLLARAREAYEAGEAVGFESLFVSQVGPSDGKQTVPWQEVKEVRLEENSLTILRDGRRSPWLKAARSEMPNWHVFKALVQPVLGNRLVEEKA